MAFDLVQYFNEQIRIQRPSLLNQFPTKVRLKYIQEMNALALGKLIILWRKDYQVQFQKLHLSDESYIEELTTKLTHSAHNESTLDPLIFESSLKEILNLQFSELRQLEYTGQYGAIGLRELVLGQIEHLTGQADDWVWSTNTLIELKGSKPTNIEDISLDITIQEFNQMVQQSHSHDEQTETNVIPTWAKVLEPVVALVILYILFNALCNVFA